MKYILILMFLVITTLASAQDTNDVYPHIRIFYNETNQTYKLTCEQNCAMFETLGTPEELNKEFPELHCPINWYYVLWNRYYGEIRLQYLVDSNGSLDNPLCLENV